MQHLFSPKQTLHNAAVLHSTTQPRQNVLLKTTVPKVSSSKLTQAAHILFDEGAQRSFISQKLAHNLQLNPTGTEIVNLASFGQQSQNVRHIETARVYLIIDRNDKNCDRCTYRSYNRRTPEQRSKGSQSTEIPTQTKISPPSDR